MSSKLKKLSQNIIAKTFLLFVAGTFVLFGITDFLMGSGRFNVAKIGKQNISINQLSNDINTRRNLIYRSSEASPETLDFLNSAQFKKELLIETIRKQLFINEADKLKITKSKISIAKKITNNKNFIRNNTFNKTVFINYLKNIESTEKQYINEQITNTTLNLLTETIILPNLSIEHVIKDIVKQNNEIRKADVITISKKSLPLDNPIRISVKEKVKYYEAHKNSFTIPELRKVSYITIDPLKEKTVIPEQKIKEEYENNKQDYTKPETRNLYYFATEDKITSEEILKDLQEKQSIKDIGKKYLDKNKKDIFMENIRQEMLDKDIRKTVFSIQEKEFTNIIESKGFYVIFYVDKIDPSRTLSLAESKEMIKELLESEIKDQLYIKTTRELEDELLLAESMDQLASKFKTKKQILKYISKDKIKNIKIPGLKNPEIIFEYEKYDFSDMLPIQGNQYVIFFIEDIKPAANKEFKIVENEINETLTQQQQGKKLQELANRVTKQLRNSNNLKMVLLRNNLKIQKNKTITRNDFDKYSSEFIDNLFSVKKVEEISKPSREASNIYKIAILKNIKFRQEDDKGYIDENTIRNEFLTSIKKDLIGQYMDYLTEKYEVKINEKTLGMLE